jgi:hypothetical protein
MELRRKLIKRRKATETADTRRHSSMMTTRTEIRPKAKLEHHLSHPNKSSQ